MISKSNCKLTESRIAKQNCWQRNAIGLFDRMMHQLSLKVKGFIAFIRFGKHFHLRQTLASLAVLVPFYAFQAGLSTANALPEVSINAVQSSVTEGTAILFKITSSPPPREDITVKFDSHAVGDFGAVFSQHVILTPEIPSAFLAVLTEDDSQRESHGSIELIITTEKLDPEYSIASKPFNSASVRITDNDGLSGDLPSVSVKAATDFIEEGGTARFQFFASRPSSELLVVNVRQEGDFLDEHFDCYTIELTEGQTTAELNLITVDDRVYERDGSITVSLVHNEHFKFTDATDSASVVVVDNDLAGRPMHSSRKTLVTSSVVKPGISIEGVEVDSIVEGGFAEFLVNASQTSTKDLTVVVSISETGTDHYQGEEIRFVTIPAFISSIPFTLETVDNSVAERNGRITLTVLPGVGYEPSESNWVSISTEDNEYRQSPESNASKIDALKSFFFPQISIMSLTDDSIREGQTARFQLMSTRAPESDLTVNLHASDKVGNFLGTSTLNSVTFPAGQTKFPFNLSTEDDRVTEPDGSFIVVVLQGEGYHLGKSIGAIVNVSDNDATSANTAIFGCGTKIDSVAKGPVPLIEIDTVPFSEVGSASEFRIKASVVVETDLSVTLELNGADSTGKWNLDLDIPLLRGEQVTSFFFPTEEPLGRKNRIHEPNISVKLEDGSNYQVNEEKYQAVTRLVDTRNLTNEISIRSLTESVTEGRSAAFQLSFSERTSGPMEVWLQFTERKENAPAHSFLQSFIVPGNRQVFPIAIGTKIDDEYFGNSEIIAAIKVGPKYTVAGAPGDKSRIRVLNDGVPVVSVRSVPVSVDEGNGIDFEISAEPVQDSSFEINYEVRQNGDYLILSASKEGLVVGRSTATFSSFSRILRLQAYTKDDTTSEVDGNITVAILNGEGYRIASGENDIATARVQDNDAPRLSLTSRSKTSTTEGQVLEFEVLASKSTANPLELNFEVSEEGSSFTDSTSQSERMPSESESLRFSVPTVDDEVDETNNVVKVLLLPGEGYNVEPESQQAEAEVEDNDDPRIFSIDSESASVEEGEPAIFTIRADGDVTREVQIAVDGGDGDYLISTPPKTVSFSNTAATRLELLTSDDEIDEPDSSIVVSIVPGEGYALHETRASAFVDVLDNDEIPAVSISSSGNDTIIEGDEALFAISVSHAAERFVNVSLSDGGSDLLASDGEVLRIDIEGREQQLFSVATVDNDRLDSERKITARILSGEGYAVENPSLSVATVSVLDNDVETRMTVTAERPEIEEGSVARFQIVSSKRINSEIPIQVKIDGEFISGPIPASVRFENRDTVALEFETEDDTQDEANGSITILIISSGENVQRARNQATVKILDNDLPTLKIKAADNYVDEGSYVNFIITSTPPPSKRLTVRIEITDSSDSYSRTETRTVIIQAGRSESEPAVFRASDSEVYQFNRQISAKLVTSTNYEVDAQVSNAAVRVYGSDSTPEISIERESLASVNEGQMVKFKIKTEFALSRPLPININVTQKGDFLPNSSFRSIVLRAEDEETILEIPTVDDNVFEQNGSVTAAIQDGPGYVLATDSADRKATIAVTDNDREIPTVTISSGDGRVTEGSRVQFIISLTRQTSNPLNVHANVTESGGFISAADSGRQTWRVPANVRSHTVNIATISNDMDEANGSVSVEVLTQSDSRYNAGTPKVATVAVENNDIPVISISQENFRVNVGEEISFTLHSTVQSKRDLYISVRITNTNVRTIDQSDSGLQTWTFPKESSNMKYVIEQQEVLSFLDGSVIVEVVDDPYDIYKVLADSQSPTAIGARSATVNVAGDTKPSINGFSGLSTVPAGSDLIADEGETIPIKLTADIPVRLDYKVSIRETISEGRNNPAPKTRIVTFPRNSTEATFNYSYNDNAYDVQKAIDLKILDDTDYELNRLGSISKNDIKILINNTDKPVISLKFKKIRQSDSENIVRLNERAIVIFASNIALNTALQVHFEVNEPTHDVLVPGRTGKISTTMNSKTFEVEIGPLTYPAQGQGKVDILLNSADSYTLGSENRIQFKVSSASAASLPIGLSPSTFEYFDESFSESEPTAPAVRMISAVVPEVSIKAFKSTVIEGDSTKFRLTSDIPPEIDLKIKLRVVQTDEGLIKGELPELVPLNRGQTEAEIAIETVDNDQEQSERTLTVEVLNGEGYTVAAGIDGKASITVLDDEIQERIQRVQDLNHEIFPDMLEAMGTRVFDSISSRVAQFNPLELNDSPEVKLDGQNTILDVLQYETRGKGDSTDTWTSLLEDSSLNYSMFTDSDSVMPTTVWGVGDYLYYTESDSDEMTNENGEIYNAALGFDMYHSSGTIGGTTVNRFASDLEYRGNSNQQLHGMYQNQLNSIHPYFGWVSEALDRRIWTSAGYGQGNVKIEEENRARETMNSTYYMLALGGVNRLIDTDSVLGGEGSINARAEFWTIQSQLNSNNDLFEDVQHNVSRLRLVAESQHRIDFTGGSSLQTFGSVGIRSEEVLQGSYFDFEANGDVNSEIPLGFTLSGSAYAKIGSSADLKEQALRGTLEYDYGRDGLGFISYVSSSIGDPHQSRNFTSYVWDNAHIANIENEQIVRQIEFELRYGHQVLDQYGKTSPYNRIVLRDNGWTEFRLGNNLNIGSKFTSDVEGYYNIQEETENIWGFSNNYKFSW